MEANKTSEEEMMVVLYQTETVDLCIEGFGFFLNQQFLCLTQGFFLVGGVWGFTRSK